MDRDALAETLAAAARGCDRRTSACLPAPAAGCRLRREEVARLAGVSVDYVVRLEQGRGSRPSAQVLGAFARALCLSRDERDHLFLLAGVEPPRFGVIDGTLRSSTMRLLTA